MRNCLKNMFYFILGGLVFGGIVYAATYYAKDVTYTPEEEASWEVNNVNEAINSLYQNFNSGDAEATDIASGKTAIVKGKLVEGTMEGRKNMTLTLKAERFAWNNGNEALRIGSTGTITTAGYDTLTIVDYSYYSDGIEYITVAGKKVQDVGKGKTINISSKTSINYTIYKSAAAAAAWVKIKLS